MIMGEGTGGIPAELPVRSELRSMLLPKLDNSGERAALAPATPKAAMAKAAY